jgi:transposase
MGQTAGASTALQARADELRRLTRTARDTRVRQRAQALLLVAEGRSIAAVARLLHTGPNRLRAWRARFLREGAAGLADCPRCGRPPKLDAAARDFLREALDRGPEAYGLPVTAWSIRDLQALLRRERGLTVSVYTVHRAVQALGYRYRRPRHDLTHRQDAAAVAAVAPVLRWLQKKALLTPDDCVWSTWMNVRSTPTHTWRRSGDDAAA